MRNMVTTTMPAVAASTPAMGRLTLNIRVMAERVATQGGRTFETSMFSTVKAAFEVAVMRLVSVPGSRSVK
jgi:hypothetical protein